MKYTVNGIVLRRKNVAEYDKIVLAYTREFGKIRLLFKGVNKPKAKLLALTEPFVESELLVVKLKNKFYDDIFKVIGGQIINFNEELKADFERFIYASRVIEVIDALTFELARDEEKFFLLKRILDVFKFAKNYEILFTGFVYRFIKLCGYRPNLKSCVRCGIKINLDSFELYFDLANGGVMCNYCVSLKEKNNVIAVDKEVIKIINMFYTLSAEEIDKLIVNEKVLKDLKELTFLYLNNYIHKPLIAV